MLFKSLIKFTEILSLFCMYFFFSVDDIITSQSKKAYCQYWQDTFTDVLPSPDSGKSSIYEVHQFSSLIISSSPEIELEDRKVDLSSERVQAFSTKTLFKPVSQGLYTGCQVNFICGTLPFTHLQGQA